MLPYKALAPSLKEVVEFKKEQDIWDEIERIIEKSTLGIGQELYYHIPLFTNPIYIVKDRFLNWINEYHYVKDYNIPMATSLDKADADKLEYFTIIKNEISNATHHLREKNGR